jgi:eukaryotic-like serine/threonine-protein kinase
MGTATLRLVVVPVVDRIGRVLGGRYRLVAPLGSGASASVYLADDETLRRRVAVKVLHPALADDDAFLRRFQSEAQVAAALNHPHVLAVHDWGQDGDTPYLVTEFLAGGSLRSMLDRHGPLSPAQVLLVGLEAARGLDYAHRRQLVHRDIKPANLLFDDEGRLRIADFGLARALAEAAWTEPMGAVLGTARYASPEQARGEALDGRSDVYSLAVALVEAATGEVPFAADTALGTLMARIDTPLPVPDTLGPLADVLVAAGAPNAAERPDAEQFAAGLLGVARNYGRPTGLPLAPPVTNMAASSPDTDVATHATPDTDVTLNGDDTLTGDTLAPARPAPGAPVPAAAPIGGVAASGGAPAAAPARSRRRGLLVVLVLLVALLAAGAYWFTMVRVVSHDVPELIGATRADAEEVVDTFNWELDASESFDDAVPLGRIIRQEPVAGTSMAEGSVLVVVISAGPPPVPMPEGIPGAPLADAISRLEAGGLTLGEVTERFDEDIAAGIVIGTTNTQLPELIPYGSAIDLTVSAGPEPRSVPESIVDKALNEVQSLLESLGLVVATTEEFSDAVPTGRVISSPEAGGKVPKGGTVALVVSKGPPVVVVPNVFGLSAVVAAQRLEAIGLVVSSIFGSPTRTVTGTNPASGTTVRIGSSITISTQ